MATSWYLQGLKNVLSGAVDMTSDTLNACLIDVADYTVNLDVDEFLDDIPGAAIVATAALAGKTFTIMTTYATFDASDTTFTAVTGDPTEALVIYQDTGVAGTSALLGYFDGAGVAVTPNGNNIIAQWNAAGILRLSRT